MLPLTNHGQPQTAPRTSCPEMHKQQQTSHGALFADQGRFKLCSSTVYKASMVHKAGISHGNTQVSTGRSPKHAGNMLCSTISSGVSCKQRRSALMHHMYQMSTAAVPRRYSVLVCPSHLSKPVQRPCPPLIDGICSSC